MAKRECPSCLGTGDRPDYSSGMHLFVPCEQCQQRGYIEPILAKRDRFYEQEMREQFAASNEQLTKEK